MTTIQLEIDEKLLHEVGKQNVKEFLESQLSVLRLKYLGNLISDKIKHSNFVHEVELEKARLEAWNEYKEKYIRPSKTDKMP